MDIPSLNSINNTSIDGNQPFKQVRIVAAKLLIGRRIKITDVRFDQPSKFHKKSDLYLFSDDKGVACGFFNSNLRKFGIKANDTIVITLTKLSSGVLCYVPTSINNKQVNSNAPQTPPQPQSQKPTVNAELLTQLANSSKDWVAFWEKIIPYNIIMTGTSDADTQRQVQELFQRYKTTPVNIKGK